VVHLGHGPGELYRYPKRIRILTIVAIFFIAICVTLWQNLSAPSFLSAYRGLQLGMSTALVQATFKRGPDYTYRVGKSTVWYLAAPQAFSRPAAILVPANGSMLPNAASLPDTYDYVTLAFDTNNKLIAFTWIGETYTVEYVGGSSNGTHFRLLPAGYL
jgi:hypothetical protein